MNRNKNPLEYYLGSLFGGAIGDAFGAPLEFLSLKEIKKKYGITGLRSFELNKEGKAIISDDTQLTLFTINGMLTGETRGAYRGVMAPISTYIYYSYLDWLTTQGIKKKCKDPSRRDSWLLEVKELNERRNPGNSCLSSLMLGDENHIYNLNNPINDSKGCGALMRIAPLGLVGDRYCDPFINASEVASFTHGHPLSYLSCQLMVLILNNIFKYEDKSLWRTIKDSVKELSDRYQVEPPRGLEPFFARCKEYLAEFIKLMRRTLVLLEYTMVRRAINKPVNDEENIRSLGEGWVAEENIAIAIYCAVRFQHDPMEVIIAASNHDGDSDSTASVAGQIIGAYKGISAFPQYFIDRVELSDVIEELASDLVNGCKFDSYSPDSIEKTIWETKYVYHHRYKKN